MVKPLIPLVVAIKIERTTQRKLAELTGLREATISEIATGRLRPRPHEMSKIARALGRPVGEIFPGAEEGA